MRYQIWLTVPVTDTYTFAVQADEGYSFSGIGPSLTNTTTRALTTTEASSGVVLTLGLIYSFSLAYMNYTTATPAFAGAGCTIQLLWLRAGGALEFVPREALRARGWRDYYVKGNNPHLHMSIYRKDPKGGFTLYNPIEFFPFMREQIVTLAEAKGYAKGESATSVWSFHLTWSGDSPNYWIDGREEVADSLRVNRSWPEKR